jgi:hypothetical protein
MKKQEQIISQLNGLVHNRFNKESLEKRLSEIFGEIITIELGNEDVDYLMDWNYMFTSEQEIIGGDFDIYVLMSKPNSTDSNTMYVTEIGYEFFDVEPSADSLDEWWGLCDFKTMEFVTGYCQHTFSAEDGYQDFVDACDKYWDNLTYDQKLSLYNKYN